MKIVKIASTICIIFIFASAGFCGSGFLSVSGFSETGAQPADKSLTLIKHIEDFRCKTYNISIGDEILLYATIVLDREITRDEFDDLIRSGKIRVEVKSNFRQKVYLSYMEITNICDKYNKPVWVRDQSTAIDTYKGGKGNKFRIELPVLPITYSMDKTEDFVCWFSCTGGEMETVSSEHDYVVHVAVNDGSDEHDLWNWRNTMFEFDEYMNLLEQGLSQWNISALMRGCAERAHILNVWQIRLEIVAAASEIGELTRFVEENGFSRRDVSSLLSLIASRKGVMKRAERLKSLGSFCLKKKFSISSIKDIILSVARQEQEQDVEQCSNEIKLIVKELEKTGISGNSVCGVLGENMDLEKLLKIEQRIGRSKDLAQIVESIKEKAGEVNKCCRKADLKIDEKAFAGAVLSGILSNRRFYSLAKGAEKSAGYLAGIISALGAELLKKRKEYGVGNMDIKKISILRFVYGTIKTLVEKGGLERRCNQILDSKSEIVNFIFEFINELKKEYSCIEDSSIDNNSFIVVADGIISLFSVSKDLAADIAELRKNIKRLSETAGEREYMKRVAETKIISGEFSRSIVTIENRGRFGSAFLVYKKEPDIAFFAATSHAVYDSKYVALRANSPFYGYQDIGIACVRVYNGEWDLTSLEDLALLEAEVGSGEIHNARPFKIIPEFRKAEPAVFISGSNKTVSSGLFFRIGEKSYLLGANAERGDSGSPIMILKDGVIGVCVRGVFLEGLREEKNYHAVDINGSVVIPEVIVFRNDTMDEMLAAVKNGGSETKSGLKKNGSFRFVPGTKAHSQYVLDCMSSM